MKKLIALVLALAMVLMVGAALATDPTPTTYSITIKRDSSWDTSDGTGDTVYTYTKILDATITGTLTGVTESSGELSGTAASGAVVYWVDTQAKATALASTSVFTVSDKAADNKWYVTSSTTSGSTIATAIQTMLADDTYGAAFTSHTQTSEGATTTIDGLDAGYYFISASNGTKLAVQTLGDVTIKEKNTYPTINKDEMDPELANATYGKTADMSVGDTINYKVSVSVPADANNNIVVTDTMATGLTFGSMTAVKIGDTALNVDTDYTVATKGESDNWTWKYTIIANDTTKDHTVDFYFTATINADAIVNQKKNDVELTYGNYHATDTVPYKLYKTAAYKYDGANYQTKLVGVVFTLKEEVSGTKTPFKVSYDNTGKYYYPDATNGSSSVTTDSNGLIIIRGLDHDKNYYLEETSNPNTGFNIVPGDTQLTLVEDTATTNAAYTPVVGTALGEQGTEVTPIENNKGTQLPSTGGIGTTIFYVLGGLLVVGAAVILVARRKASN